MSAGALLANLRGLQGYRRAELLDKIEKDYGRGFRKSLQEQLRLEARSGRCESAPGTPRADPSRSTP